MTMRPEPAFITDFYQMVEKCTMLEISSLWLNIRSKTHISDRINRILLQTPFVNKYFKLDGYCFKKVLYSGNVEPQPHGIDAL